MRSFARFIDRRLEEVVCVTLLAALLLLLCLQVFLRPLGAALSWQEEAVRLVFLWLNFFAYSLATKAHAHFRVEAIEERLGPLRRALLSKTVIVVWIGFNLFLLVACLRYYESLGRFAETSPVMGIRQSHAFSVVPIAVLLSTWRLLQRLALPLPSPAGAA